MEIKSKFKFKQIVRHKLGEKQYMILKFLINYDGKISYSCVDDTGAQYWFVEPELVAIKKNKPIRITLK